MTKLVQDWHDNFMIEEGVALTHTVITDTVDAATGAKTSEATGATNNFTANFRVVSEEDELVKSGEMNVGEAFTFTPLSITVNTLDRITNGTAIWEVRKVLRRVTHNQLILFEYTR